MKLAYLTLATALVASPVMASDLLYAPRPVKPSIHEASGPYIGIKGGLNTNDDVSANVTPTTGGTGDFDNGFNAGITAGYAFGDWGYFSPRLEIEAGYLTNSLESIQAFNAGGPTGAPFAAAGDLTAFYGLANILFDVPLTERFGAFAGGGVGFGKISADNINVSGFTLIDDDDTAFAWNLTAGLSYELTRNVTVEASYRFLQFHDVNLNGVGPIVVNDDVDNHQVNIGLRVKI